MRGAGATVVFLAAATIANAQASKPTSQGVYRFPYETGNSVDISNDYSSHPSTFNRMDMGADTTPATIVSAGSGIVRRVVDNNQTFCPRSPASLNQFDINGNGRLSSLEIQIAASGNPANFATIVAGAFAVCANYNGPSLCCMRGLESITSCTASGAQPGATCTAGADGDGPNNYIWIEHTNGEWSKYTHILSGSAEVVEGQQVDAGDPLGTEGDVGFATSPHLHFEISLPDQIESNGMPFTPAGNLLDDGRPNDVDGDGTSDSINLQNRIPVFCQLGFRRSADDNTSPVACDNLCPSANEILNENVTDIFYRQVADTATLNGFSVQPGAGATVKAGSRVVLRPGVTIDNGAYFNATIGSCDAPGRN